MPKQKIQNLLLKHLPSSSLEAVLRRSTLIDHPRNALIAEKNEPLKYVYFPEARMVSIVLVTNEGVAIEVGVIGREGFAGIPLILGSKLSDRKIFSQLPGFGWRIEVDDFAELIEQNQNLHNMCKRFTLTMINQISQTAACNRLHSIEVRCARWLLLAHDQSDSTTVDLTQEFLSMMLGVRRSGVNIAINVLEKAGLIEHVRGSVRIMDRQGLEDSACSCYRDVKEYFVSTMDLTDH